MANIIDRGSLKSSNQVGADVGRGRGTKVTGSAQMGTAPGSRQRTPARPIGPPPRKP